MTTSTEFQRARTPQQQETRRQQILDAARDLVDELPVTEISLRELARRVGLAKSNVVRYFPTREAVFLDLLVEDWSGWLDALEAALPRTDGSHPAVARAVIESLARRPRLCRLLASKELILEPNVPADFARVFKRVSLANASRLAGLLRSASPGLDDRAALEVAGMVTILIAGAWPVANPHPVVAEVLREPEFARMRVDHLDIAVRTLTAVLDAAVR